MVDARGYSCPMPVIMVQKAVKNGAPDTLEVMVDNPRKRFGLPLGKDFSIWDLEEEYEIDPAEFVSMGKATTFNGWKVNGRCVATVCDGKPVYEK